MKYSILYLLDPIFIGLGATLTFDLWAQFLKHVFKITPSNFCLVGRWLRYMSEGIFKHSNIGSASEKSWECAVGWIAHYMIGIVFSIIFIACVGDSWLQQPVLRSALIFGVITVSAPFFIMQPLFGLGFASSKTPNPAQARLRSLINHTAFGIGLYLSGLLFNWLI